MIRLTYGSMSNGQIHDGEIASAGPINGKPLEVVQGAWCSKVFCGGPSSGKILSVIR